MAVITMHRSHGVLCLGRKTLETREGNVQVLAVAVGAEGKDSLLRCADNRFSTQSHSQPAQCPSSSRSVSQVQFCLNVSIHVRVVCSLLCTLLLLVFWAGKLLLGSIGMRERGVCDKAIYIQRHHLMNSFAIFIILLRTESIFQLLNSVNQLATNSSGICKQSINPPRAAPS